MKAVFEAIFVIIFILVTVVGSVVGLGYAFGMILESAFEDEDYISGNYPKITFNLFTEMYAISPNKWEFHDTHVRYQRRIIVFKTKRDYRKYQKFKEKEETRKQEVERLKGEAELAKFFQADIDRYRAETLKEMKSHLPENMIPHDTGALRRSNTYEQKE